MTAPCAPALASRRRIQRVHLSVAVTPQPSWQRNACARYCFHCHCRFDMFDWAGRDGAHAVRDARRRRQRRTADGGGGAGRVVPMSRPATQTAAPPSCSAASSVDCPLPPPPPPPCRHCSAALVVVFAAVLLHSALPDWAGLGRRKLVCFFCFVFSPLEMRVSH